MAQYRAISVAEVQLTILTTNGAGSKMQCYEHAKANETKEAVAVCAKCGAALCMEHLVVITEMALDSDEQQRRIYCHTCSGQK